MGARLQQKMGQRFQSETGQKFNWKTGQGFQWKIGARVNLIVFFLCIAILIIGVLGVRTASLLNQDLNHVYNSNMGVLQQLVDVKIAFQNHRIFGYEYALAQEKYDKDKSLAATEDAMNSLEAGLKALEKADYFQKDQDSLLSMQKALDEYKFITEKIIQASVQENPDAQGMALGIVLSEGPAVINKLDQAINLLMDTQVRLAEDTKKAADARYQKTESQLMIIIVLCVIISLIYGVMLSRGISKLIGLVAAHAGIIAEGDFSQAVPENLLKRKDEIGMLAAAFNHMQDRLSGLIGSIMGSSESLAAATQQMSASTEEISGGAQEQSDQIQQVSMNIERVAGMSKQVVEKAQQAFAVAHKAKETAQKGETAIKNVKTGIETIDGTMEKLNDNSEKIGEIVDVINDIADQTNLLALNAAIEAARAGEHGRGFAVVADEVRKLAEHSGKATKEIIQLIATIQKDTADAVTASRKGGQIAVEANQAFLEIHHLVSSNAEMVKDIVDAIRQVEADTGQVAAAGERISAATEESAAGVEEVSASAQEMAQMAERLQTMVSNFKTG